MNLEILTSKPDGQAKPTPLLFVHGAWHAAWCWEPFFLPYFAQHGYECYALSLRGHGNSANTKALRWTRASDYVADVAQVVSSLKTLPVMIGHSMGGYVLQKYLENHTVPAAVLVASIPSFGTLPYFLRQMVQHPLAMLKTTFTLSTYPLVGTPELTKAAFFSPDIDEAVLRRYFARIQDESFMAGLDTALLNRLHPERVKTPLLILGAANDAVFPVREVEATARVYRTQATIFPNMAHDMMVEKDWQAVADKILGWLAEREL